MKRIFYFLLAASMIVGAAGCKKSFFDINDNPNSPTDESITPQLLLPRVLNASAARMGVSYASFARWMGYWTRSGSYGPNGEEETYKISTTYESGQWNGWYDILFDAHTMEQKAIATNQDFYEGIAKVIKSIGFMYLVDMYNNVPYTKAFDLQGNILPSYDKGQDIYNDLFNQLDQALTLITNASANENIGLPQYDILFGGDKTKWKKLINTQRLKLVLRMVNVSGFNASAQIAKVTSEGFINAGETAAVQPGYAKSRNAANVSQQNPYWDAFKTTYNDQVADAFNRANNYTLNIMKNSSDPRYMRIFSPVPSACASCSPPVTAGSYFGYDYGDPDYGTGIPQSTNSSDVGGPGIAKAFNQPQWIFTSVESMFLQAEAIQRGLLTGAGTAQDKYNAAITESFTWLNVPSAATAAATYIASGQPVVAWPATPADQLIKIVHQKYLALAGINNFEAWVDYRRTGVPRTGLPAALTLPLSLAPNRGGNIIPLRLQYPQAEFNYNAANVAAEGTIDPQTSTVFWDR